MTTEAAKTATLKQKAIAFSKPDQIKRILTEAANLNLEILVRYDARGTAVRAKVVQFSQNDQLLMLGSISAAGDQALRTYDSVLVEFVLLSTKLKFQAKIRGRAQGKLALNMPEKLFSIERRQNSRFKVPVASAAFVEFQDFKIDTSVFDAPFSPKSAGGEKHIIPRLRIDDISLGGIAGFTRSGALAKLLKPSDQDVLARIYFPNMMPFTVPVTLRWLKKTVSNVPSGKFLRFQQSVGFKLRGSAPVENLGMSETFFRIGIQFSEISKDIDSALRTFIKMVQTVESL